MNRPLILSSMVLLTLLGFIVAWYLTQCALSGAELACGITGLDGCNLVAQSPYSKLFGLPLALYGAVFYALFFVITSYAFIKVTKKAALVLLAFGITGALSSVYFLYLQFFIIKAFCIYCVASAVISFFLLGGSVLFWQLFTDSQKDVVV